MQSAAFKCVACAAAFGIALRSKNDTLIALTLTCITGTFVAMLPHHLAIPHTNNNTKKQNTTAANINNDADDTKHQNKDHYNGNNNNNKYTKHPRHQKSGNQFLVIPDVESYDRNPFPTRWRLVIEYNHMIGPVAVHFENGLRWGFLSACLSRHKKDLKAFIGKWNIFLEDYHRATASRNTTSKYTARAGRFLTNTFYLTLSSERVLLNDMLVGENLFKDDDEHHYDNEEEANDDEDMTKPRRRTYDDYDVSTTAIN